MKIKIVRRIDRLGRIVIPKDVRTTLNLRTDEDVEISVENNTVVLKKIEIEKSN